MAKLVQQGKMQWDKAKAPYLTHESDNGDWLVTQVAIEIEEKA